MKIVRMKRGEAPAAADRIYIERRPDGCAAWVGAVRVAAAPEFGNSKGAFDSVAEAEADAIEWARSKRVAEIIIEEDDI